MQCRTDEPYSFQLQIQNLSAILIHEAGRGLVLQLQRPSQEPQKFQLRTQLDFSRVQSEPAESNSDLGVRDKPQPDKALTPRPLLPKPLSPSLLALIPADAQLPSHKPPSAKHPNPSQAIDTAHQPQSFLSVYDPPPQKQGDSQRQTKNTRTPPPVTAAHPETESKAPDSRFSESLYKIVSLFDIEDSPYPFLLTQSEAKTLSDAFHIRLF